MKIGSSNMCVTLVLLLIFGNASFGSAQLFSQRSRLHSTRSVLHVVNHTASSNATNASQASPPLLGNLIGTWVGTCQQFGAWDNTTDTAYCLSYSVQALKYDFTITYDTNGSVTYYMGASYGSSRSKNVTTKYSHPPRYALPGDINITAVAQYKSTSAVCMTWSSMDMISTQVLVSVTDGVYMQVGAYGVPSDSWIDTKDCYPSITPTTKLYCNAGGPKAYNYICLAKQVK